MSDLVINIPFHGYSNNTTVYVSWLNNVYFVADKNNYAFKITVVSGSSDYIQYDSAVTEGYVRQVDSTSGVLTITGLDHIENEDVYVTSGGVVVGLYTVENGEVTVPEFLFTYQVGLPYKMKIRTMRLSVPQQDGTIQTRIKRINETVVRYIRSLGGSAGQEHDGIEYLTELDTTFSSQSQDDTKLTKGGFSEDAYTVISSTDPLPMTVLSTIVSFEVEERR